MNCQVQLATVADVDRVAPLFDAYRRFFGLPSDLPLATQYLADRLLRDESVVLLGAPHALMCCTTYSWIRPQGSVAWVGA